MLQRLDTRAFSTQTWTPKLCNGAEAMNARASGDICDIRNATAGVCV